MIGVILRCCLPRRVPGKKCKRITAMWSVWNGIHAQQQREHPRDSGSELTARCMRSPEYSERVLRIFTEQSKTRTRIGERLTRASSRKASECPQARQNVVDGNTNRSRHRKKRSTTHCCTLRWIFNFYRVYPYSPINTRHDGVPVYVFVASCQRYTCGHPHNCYVRKCDNSRPQVDNGTGIENKPERAAHTI